MKQDLDSFSTAYQAHFKFHDENLIMLGWYARRIIGTMRARPCLSVLSLGIGHQVVAKAILKELGTALDNYTIVEGSSEIIRTFSSEVNLPPNVNLVHSFFENYTSAKQFDAIEMGFVLEHLDDAAAILNHYSKFVKPGGSIFIAVPNARSLHRLIGQEAGFLDNLYRLSQEDLELGHQHYFDFNSLSELVLNAGLKIVHAEGILLKPFTTNQLKSLNLSPAVITGLLKTGVNYPGICNSMLFEVTP